MPEDVWDELERLGIFVQGVLQFRSGRCDQDAAKAHPVTQHFIVTVARGPEVDKVRSLTELCGLRVSVETYVGTKGPLQCKRCKRFGHTQRYCGYVPRCVASGKAHLSGECSTPLQQLKCSSCGGNHTANCRGYAILKVAKAALAKRAPVVRSKVGGTPSPPLPRRRSGRSRQASRRGWELAGST